MQNSQNLDLGRISQPVSYPMRKYKFPPSKTHFMINAFGKEYLLFLAETSGFIISFEEGILKLQKEFKFPPL